MAVKVKIGPYEAIIDGYQWSVPEDKDFEDLLNARLEPFGPSGSDPYPDYTAAQQVVSDLGGEIVEFDKPKPLPPGAIL